MRGVEAFAELSAALADPFADRSSTLAAAGLDEALWRSIEDGWLERFKVDAARQGDLAVRYGETYAVITGGAATPVATDATARQERLRVLGENARPWQEEAAAVTPGVSHRTFDAQPALPPSSAFVTEVLGEGENAAAETTLAALNISGGPALPFGRSPSQELRVAEARPRIAQEPRRAHDDADRTMEPGHVVARPATPFGRAPAGPRVLGVGDDRSDLDAETVEASCVGVDLRGALPFALPAPGELPLSGAGELPALSLEEYASLCATVAVFPDREEATLARYGVLGVDARLALDAHWQAQFQGDPLSLVRWRALYVDYCGWLSASVRASAR
jgi:hypothetical protein